MPGLSTKQKAFLARVVDELDAGGVNVPSAIEVASNLRVPVQAVEGIVSLGVESGELAALTEGLVYSKTRLAFISARAEERFGSRPFSVSEFRDAFRTSRKYAVPLLEYFDSIGVTRRTGDRRTLAAQDSSVGIDDLAPNTH